MKGVPAILVVWIVDVGVGVVVGLGCGVLVVVGLLTEKNVRYGFLRMRPEIVERGVEETSWVEMLDKVFGSFGQVEVTRLIRVNLYPDKRTGYVHSDSFNNFVTE